MRSTRGFTLLEVLLAVALSLMLLVAVYGALNLYYKYSQVGQAEMERSQIARALLNRMAVDIRSVVFRRAEEEDASAGGESTSDDSEETITVEVIDPEESYLTQSVGVFGDSETLVLHISRPRAAQLEIAETATSSSDLQSVSYFLVSEESEGALPQLVAQQASENSTIEDAETSGLARMEGDRLAMNLADEQGDLESMASQARILAPEVDYLQFQYFDGAEWLDEWDSVAYEALPLAITITLGFRASEESQALTFSGIVGSSTNLYRLVVALPLAEPTETETTTE